MAKKVVATLKTGTGKNFTKCIKMVKSDKTGAYMFKEGIIPNDRMPFVFYQPSRRIRICVPRAPGNCYTWEFRRHREVRYPYAT